MQKILEVIDIVQLNKAIYTSNSILINICVMYDAKYDDVISLARNILIEKLTAFDHTIDSKYIDLKFRLSAIVSLIGTEEFNVEFDDINSCLDVYRVNEIVHGWRRARRYAITNRIESLLYDERINQRAIGYVLNEIEGRGDPQLIKTLNKIIDRVKIEFNL